MVEARTLQVNRHVGSRIRQRREALCYSLEHLAQAVGVSDYQVSKYELGANRVAAGRLFAIAEALQVSIGWFFEDLVSSPISRAPGRSGVLDLARNFSAITNEKHAAALGEFAETLAAQSLAARRAHEAPSD